MWPTTLSGILMLLALINLASTFQQGSNDRDATVKITPQVSDIALPDNIVRVSLAESFQQTLDLIKNAESLPSCAKIATSALMHSCSALEGSVKHDESSLDRGSDLFIDEEAGVYSVRLAVCELSSADFLIPKECKPFIPTEKTAKKRGLRGYWTKSGPTQPTSVFQYYDEITQANFQQCRKALGSTAQSWTSYSNSRQNAVVMCRAMRSEIEKDEQLHAGKILAGAATTATSSFQEVYDQANKMKEMFHELTTSMPRFQQDLVAGKEQHLERLREFWAEVRRLQDSMNDIVKGAAGVTEELRDAKGDISGFRSTIQETTNESTSAMKDLVAGAGRQIGELSEPVEQIANQLGFMREVAMQEIIRGLYNTNQSVEAINAFMPVLQRTLIAWEESSMKAQIALNEKQTEGLVIAAQTNTDMKEINEGLREVKESFGWLSEFLAGWPGALELIKSSPAFMGYGIVWTLLSFAVLDKSSGFSFKGNVAASIASGLVLASVSISFSLANISGSIIDLLSDTISNTELAAVFCLGIVIGIILTVVYLKLTKVFRRNDRTVRDSGNVEYDPASPTFLPSKWEV